MKTIFITGNHPRHIYLVKKFTRFFKNFFWIIEKRDLNINHKIYKKSDIYINHINDFKNKEKIYFKNTSSFLKKNKKRIFNINRNKTNNEEFNKKIDIIFKKIKPKLLFSYGCQKIDINRIKNNDNRYFNIHGGLLPKYRGVNTNFWPHINFESNHIGLTLHGLNNKIDSGDIFFQTTVKIDKKDTINNLSCKAVKTFCDVVPRKIFISLKKNFKVEGIKFKSKFKLWLKKDFKPKDNIYVQDMLDWVKKL